MAIRLCDALRAAGSSSAEEMRGVLASLFSNVDTEFAPSPLSESDCNSLVAEVLVLPLGDRRTDQSRLASGDGDV